MSYFFNICKAVRIIPGKVLKQQQQKVHRFLCNLKFLGCFQVYFSGDWIDNTYCLIIMLLVQYYNT